MPETLKVLHLFDQYLPNTMNWAYRLIRHLPNVRNYVAVHWLVQNQYVEPDFIFWENTFQRLTGLRPTDEWQYDFIRRVCGGLAKKSGLFAAMLRRKIAATAPDVIHAHFGPVACPYLDVLEQSGVPLVVSFYGADFSKIPAVNPAILPQYHRLFQLAKCVVVSGNSSGAQVVALGCPPEKLRLIHLSVDLQQFDFKVRQKPAGRLRLAQIATFTEKKGHLLSLKAFHRALPSCPNMKLVLGGEPYKPYLVQEVAAYIAQHNLAEHVALRGFVPHATLRDLLWETDVFIHPSQRAPDGDMEGPVVANMEALATGCPVISTFHSDIPEVVTGGKSGLLVAEKDVDALADAIRQFYRMPPETYETFSRYGRQHIERHYAVIQESARLRDLYADICTSSLRTFNPHFPTTPEF